MLHTDESLRSHAPRATAAGIGAGGYLDREMRNIDPLPREDEVVFMCIRTTA